MSGSLQLYEFSGSVWSNAPKIAIEEGGFKKGQDYDYITINLAEGANFDPSYLKINPAGTVPTLIVGKDTFTDSISAVAEINKLAPNKPKGKVSGGVSLIEEIHGAAIDPNATLLLATDDKDREVKANGLPKAFLAGRQKALNQFSQSPPAEFKDFLNKKREDNLQLLDFYSGAPDEQTRKAHYAQGQQLWSSVGAALQGFVADALTKNHQGPYVGGSEPSEADFHLITWLARTITNAGVEPGTNADDAIKQLQAKTGASSFDDSIKLYWETWTARDSFKNAGVH
ncbi:hypothetical protein, variant 1 [Cryptococcus amylolentus CBS 6039]|uniref:GST N-terminal domain-containing protein n=2 Tax=Cryptococcus amylolentus TaxID=104669 RepID=A0A1E3I0P1_9TREE|nr:hypothetical protein, variant 1 [Cryptococcus amylolentus CBS 6039]ODN82170.1 hypothetical protein, variant 1 [Cryptococcus amylolentus CBS 6039]ODO09737.1 hypothetical protein I350_01953 [Cryptococcus amylolentus CBS 6273]